ncbi:tubulin-specific chaperone E-like isoform X2 [Physella acuta]|uniref:tubulin-specific chaperone E-like isoform X2 n=1 Tax=Physella acuta TaxID=109671 RepID=UPI0027DACE59|nr:tubulin-specific chaperone E-like isoform X2 [Physella acuta]
MEDAGLLRADGTIIQVGDRIVCDNHRAFVRYIGTVPPTTGIWLGVEWDDPSRGKHDGSHEGKTYFHTSHPKSGSFVRPSKVNGGISAVQAVHERYGLKKDDEAGIKKEELFVLDQFLNQTKVEMVGAKKINQQQSQFNRLKKISMFDMKVYSGGPPGELGKTCPNITDLDISTNLISSWENVAEIAGHLPFLKELNVSDNRLIIPKDPSSLACNFSKLRNATMNQMNLSWKEVLTCCSMFPCLEELHVSFNQIASLSDATHVLKGLRILDLMTNQISDWGEVLKLGNLPMLDTLIISENQIKSIYFPSCLPTDKTSHFKQLKALIIKRNEILEWSSIDELNKLQHLEDIQIAENPILKTFTYETVRQLLIAKISGLKLISRTPISFEERKGAEIDYLKRFGTEWKAEGGSVDKSKNNPSNQFIANHPRYQAIADKWGAPEDSELCEKSSALKDNLLAIKIFSPQHPEKGTLDKKLPGTMSIEKLKTLIQRLYRMNTEPKLTYSSHKKSNGPQIDLDNDMRQLGFFSIEAGDTILVSW